MEVMTGNIPHCNLQLSTIFHLSRDCKIDQLFLAALQGSWATLEVHCQVLVWQVSISICMPTNSSDNPPEPSF